MDPTPGDRSRSRPHSRPRAWAALFLAFATVTVFASSAIAGPSARSAPNRMAPSADEMGPDTQLEPLIREIPQHVFDEADVIDPDHEPAAYPPTIEPTIRPGRAILIDIPDNGTFACTMNFVYEDATGDLYLGTAGHCVLPAGMDAATDPDFQQPTVKVCARFCAGGGFTATAGQFVTMGEVLFARQAQDGEMIGYDYAFVDIPDAAEDIVDPQIPFWQGPTEERDMVQFGEQVTIYGQGLGYGDAEADARTGMALGQGVNGPEGSWAAALAASPGDSGGPAMTDIDPLAPSTGTSEALGDLTHTLAVGPAPLTGIAYGTLSEQGVAMAEEEAGVQLTLVIAEDNFPQ